MTIAVETTGWIHASDATVLTGTSTGGGTFTDAGNIIDGLNDSSDATASSHNFAIHGNIPIVVLFQFTGLSGLIPVGRTVYGIKCRVRGQNTVSAVVYRIGIYNFSTSAFLGSPFTSTARTAEVASGNHQEVVGALRDKAGYAPLDRATVVGVGFGAALQIEPLVTAQGTIVASEVEWQFFFGVNTKAPFEFRPGAVTTVPGTLGAADFTPSASLSLSAALAQEDELRSATASSVGANVLSHRLVLSGFTETLTGATAADTVGSTDSIDDAVARMLFKTTSGGVGSIGFASNPALMLVGAEPYEGSNPLTDSRGFFATSNPTVYTPNTAKFLVNGATPPSTARIRDATMKVEFPVELFGLADSVRIDLDDFSILVESNPPPPPPPPMASNPSTAPLHFNIRKFVSVANGAGSTIVLGDSQFDANSSFRLEQALMRGLPKIVKWAGRGFEDGTSGNASHAAHGIWSFISGSAALPKSPKPLDVSINNVWADGRVNIAPRMAAEWVAPTPPVVASNIELAVFGLTANFYGWVDNGNSLVQADQWPISNRIKFRATYRSPFTNPLNLNAVVPSGSRHTPNGDPFSRVFTNAPQISFPIGPGVYATIEHIVEPIVNGASGDPYFRLSTPTGFTPGAAGMSVGFMSARAQIVDINGSFVHGFVPIVLQAGGLLSAHHSNTSPRYADETIIEIVRPQIPTMLMMMFHNDSSNFAQGVLDVFNRWSDIITNPEFQGQEPHVLVIAPWVSQPGQPAADFSRTRTEELFALCVTRGWSFINLHDWFGGAPPSDDLPTKVDPAPNYTYDPTTHPSTQADVQGLAEAFNWIITDATSVHGFPSVRLRERGRAYVRGV